MLYATGLQVVFFNDLTHSGLAEDGFPIVSYGDAQYTLVYAEALISELEAKDDSSLKPLIDELKDIPSNIYVALDGPHPYTYAGPRPQWIDNESTRNH